MAATPSAARVALADAQTQPIDPQLLGELLTWREGARNITAWIGVDALDALEDLDFEPLHTGKQAARQWTTAAYPTLFLVDATTGSAAPCDKIYVSTEGLPGSVGPSVIAELHVDRGPASAVFGSAGTS